MGAGIAGGVGVLSSRDRETASVIALARESRYELSRMFFRPPARALARRLTWGAGVVALGLLSTGCIGWGRLSGGGAQDLRNRNDFSGAFTGFDGAIGTKYLKTGQSPLRLAIHMSADAVLASERKSIGWGTGLVAYTEPRPISPFAILGTSAHFDQIGGRYSFGNVSPYAEVGVRTSVPTRYEDGGNGWFMSLGIGGMSSFNYLVGGSNTVDGFLVMKLGVGWEKN